MEIQISDENRKIFERIESKNLEAQELSSFVPDSTGKGPGALTIGVFFEEVKNLETFLFEYMLWQREKKIQAQREEVEKRLANLNEKGIVPGKPYDDYDVRFQYMLDTLSLLGELSEWKKAEELANTVLQLAEVAGPGSNDPFAISFQLSLRAEALWTIAGVFAKNEFFEESLKILNELYLFMKQNNPDSANTIQENIAARHFSLAKSGMNQSKNLKVSKELLGPLALKKNLSMGGWITYIQTLFELGNYQEASRSIAYLLKVMQKKDRNISGIPLSEFVDIQYLAKLNTPNEFRKEFGPYSAPIYAECKRIYLSEAWESIYQEPLPFSTGWSNYSGAILMGNVVIYEKSNDLIMGRQPDVTAHEYIHLSVRNQQTFKSKGKWFIAYRDVPTAALFTYINQIEDHLKTGTPLPDCLQFFVELGKKAVKAKPSKANHYIENMLKYFEMRGEETNASYQCAAIQAGMLLEIIGPPGSKKMESYISHLKIMGHKNALARAKQKIDLMI